MTNLDQTAESSTSPSTSHLPDPSLPAPLLQDSEEGFTAAQLIERQAELEREAREAVPFSYTKGGCTYSFGSIRQPIYACKTCGGGGVCAGCSIGCHADHELIELFAKRNFRCDCGTLSICRKEGGGVMTTENIKPCSLREKELIFAPENDENTYNQNFQGQFCRCQRGKTYDPEREEETMFQCLCCEDWLHESCTSLRPSKFTAEKDEINSPDRSLSDGPLVDHEVFDLFICHECIIKPKHRVLQKYLGAKGWIICIPERLNTILPSNFDNIAAIPVQAKGDGWTTSWKIFGLENGTVAPPQALLDPTTETSGTVEHLEQAPVAAVVVEEETKRKVEEDILEGEKERDAKRIRKEVNGLTVLDCFSDADDEDFGNSDQPLIAKDVGEDEEICIEPHSPLFVNEENVTRFDVFLTESFRERICRCRSCQEDWKHFPYFLQAEETYSPPRSQIDDDPVNVDQIDGRSETGNSQTSSTYDLGLAALKNLPRERMMESLQAYNKMRDALFDHLRPFADQGKVVDAESVREFFRKQREG